MGLYSWGAYIPGVDGVNIRDVNWVTFLGGVYSGGIVHGGRINGILRYIIANHWFLNYIKELHLT